MPSVVVSNIKKRFDETVAVDDVSLEIAEGEFLTLLGPSGCGKSTLLRIIAGLEPQTSGSVAIEGTVVDRLRPKQRDVAMVFQSYALYPHMTVAQNMALPLIMRQMTLAQRLPLIGRALPGTGAKRRSIDATVQQVADTLEIGHLLNRKPGQLSGGQRQRVALGRAIVRRPKVFLMDEPLSNLDAKLRVQMRAEITELHRRLGITFIYVTHDQSEAMTMSDRVAVMLDGALLQVASPQEIYASPEDRRVAAFIGSPRINLLDGTVRKSGEVAAAGTVLTPAGEFGPGLEPGASVTLGIRPEAFHLADSGGPGVVSGRVRLVEHMGSDLFVHLDVPGTSAPLIARLLVERAPQISHGEILHLRVRTERILLFTPDGRRIRNAALVTPLRSVAP